MKFNSSFALATLFTILSALKSSKASFACSTADFNKGPELDNTDDSDVVKNTTRHLPVWTGRISVSLQNFRSVQINWDGPSLSNTSLCAYSVHYYPKRANGMSKHLTFHVPPATTNVPISNLEIGTRYYIYVEAIFNQSVPGTPDAIYLLKSWLMEVTTLGYGPDNPCKCHPKGTKEHLINECDRETGKCECKNAMLTNGLTCDSCVEHSYMDNTLGCTHCDQCSNIGSTGSCLPAPEEGMLNCICKANHTGKHCLDCPRGFYRVDPKTEVCKPCNCSGNGDHCNTEGICTLCGNNTMGEHCELCLVGHLKDNTGSCHLITNEVTGHKAGIAILVLVIMVATVILIVIIVRKVNRRHRLQGRGSMKASGSGVNFSTLDEEPNIDFNHGHRKLRIGGPSSNI